MDAPLYRPALAFEQPAAIAYKVTTSNTAVATLLAIPAAKAILLAQIPSFDARISSPQLKPHLGNFSLRSLVQFGLFKADDLDRIDQLLSTMPPSTQGVQ